MNPVLKEILDIFNVEQIERDLYRGQNHNTEHVFGGQVLAQALAAAYRTIEAPHQLHSMHAYFLRAGDGKYRFCTKLTVYATGVHSAPAGLPRSSMAKPSSACPAPGRNKKLD
jgi:hypothetical protein